jgi:protein TonB
MTRNQILGLCIAASFFLHMWGLDLNWRMDDPAGGDEMIIPANFAIAADVPAGDGMALEQAVDTGSDHSAESAARRLLRQARRRYFQQVREAVERRKFQAGGDLSGLIGNVLYSFSIRADDSFADVRIRRSSGDPALDRAARNAILAASGRVKRPDILKGQRFNLSVAVKYQYNL